MPEVETIERPETSTDEAPAPRKRKTTKVKAKTAKAPKASKKKNGGVARARLLYRLAAGVKVDEYDYKTHAGQLVRALHKTGEADNARVVAEVSKNWEKSESTMAVNKAMSYMLNKLQKEGVVLTKNKKAESKKAA